MLYRLSISVFVLFIHLRKMRGGGRAQFPLTVLTALQLLLIEIRYFVRVGHWGGTGGLDGIWSTGASECQKSWLEQYWVR